MLSALKNNRFFRAVVTLASASAAGQLIILAAMPYLTRLYAPEAFGVFAVFSSLMGVVLVVSSLRYELAIPLPAIERNARRLVFISLVINAATAILALIFVSVFRFRISEWTDTPLLASFLWLLPVAIMTGGTYKALNYWAIRNKEYGKIAGTKLLQSSANVFAQVLGGLAGLGPIGLIVGQIIGQSAGMTKLMKGLRPSHLWLEASWLHSLSLMSRYRNFLKYDTPASAVNTASAHLPNIAMALIFGPATAGLYYLAERILWVPMSMVGHAVGQVLFSQTRECIANGTLLNTTLNLLLCLTLLATLIALPVFFWAEPVFKFIFGETWGVSGTFASWLVLGLCVQFIYSPLSMTLLVTGGQKINLLIHSVILAMKILAFYIASFVGYDVAAVKLLSIALVVGYGIGIMLVIYDAHKVSHHNSVYNRA